MALSPDDLYIVYEYYRKYIQVCLVISIRWLIPFVCTDIRYASDAELTHLGLCFQPLIIRRSDGLTLVLGLALGLLSGSELELVLDPGSTFWCIQQHFVPYECSKAAMRAVSSAAKLRKDGEHFVTERGGQVDIIYLINLLASYILLASFPSRISSHSRTSSTE